MKTLAPFVVVAGLLTAVPAAELAGQVPGDDRMSLALVAGTLVSTTELSDGTSFTSGAAFGIAGRIWLGEMFGFQGTLLHGSIGAEADPVTIISHRDPNAFLVEIGPVFRYPMELGSLVLSPQVGVSAGAKGYRWATVGQGARPTAIALAWDVVGGIDLRRASSPRWGLIAEVRRVSSKFTFFTFTKDNEDVSDMALTLGVSINR